MRVLLTLTLLGTSYFWGSSLSAQISQAKFEELHQSVNQSDEAPWRTIPWKISLLDAQAIAAREQKPIFIWAMDGHPLGCT